MARRAASLVALVATAREYDASRAAQLAALREDLRPLRADRKVRIVPYSLDKQ